MSKNYGQDPLIKDLLVDLESRFSDHIISVFGLGSYFDQNLPPNWIKNDVDLVVIMDSLDSIPKQDWTKVRYEKKRVGDKEIWLGFNSLESLKNREQFRKESFANYEWSLLDLKLPDNSAHLYGRNIRAELLEITNLHFDYDDILIRSMYHLNNSFKEGTTQKAMREFTKGVFKFGFYLCIYFDLQFRSTSIVKIIVKVKQLVLGNKIDSVINTYFEEAVIYRMMSEFKTKFMTLRDEFVKFVFNLVLMGSLHKKMDKSELNKFLSNSFSGLLYLIRFTKKMEVPETAKFEKVEFGSFTIEDSQLNTSDIRPNMKSITITGRIKEIYRKSKFDKDDGSKGQVASFLLHDPSGDMRVVLWDEHAKVSSRNEFNVNKLVKIYNAYAKTGRAGTEIHVSKYGSINLSPQGVNLTKHPSLRSGKRKAKKEDITQRIQSIGISEVKVKRIICPFCGFMCFEKLKICGKCGEHLPNS